MGDRSTGGRGASRWEDHRQKHHLSARTEVVISHVSSLLPSPERLVCKGTAQRRRTMTEVIPHADRDTQRRRTFRVLLVEHHLLIREGLRRLLESESGLEVVAEVDSGEEGCLAVQRWQPDIAIVDLALPDGGGVEVVEAIKAHCHATALVAFSGYDDEQYRRALLMAGAAAVVLKDGHGQTLLEVLRALQGTQSG
jgi:CheY-like chemotaxis protein